MICKFLSSRFLKLLPILFMTITFSLEGKLYLQEDKSFQSVLFYLTFSTERQPSSHPNSDTLFDRQSSNILSITESMVIRNRIKKLLEEDYYDD